MNRQLKLPVGIENFQEIRQLGFYYVDKTKMIEHLLSQWGKVNLFTRPRRFGKTLNMSMLRYFFEIGTDPTLFDGLFISQNKELCETYLGKFPVVFLSLKNVDGLTFEEARYRLTELIAKEAPPLFPAHRAAATTAAVRLLFHTPAAHTYPHPAETASPIAIAFPPASFFFCPMKQICAIHSAVFVKRKSCQPSDSSHFS